jgi:hypothetical protein
MIAAASRAKRAGAARDRTGAHTAAMSALPMDGATAYRLDRTGTNSVIA